MIGMIIRGAESRRSKCHMSSQPHRIVIPALFLLILVTIWAVSHLEFVPREGFEIVPAQAISGDEPIT